MNKEVTQIQIAWFFSKVFMGNFENFSLKLKNKLGESKTTRQLPIPNDAPNEIPRLILSYPAFNLNVAKNRIDLFLFLKDIGTTKNIISDINGVILDDFHLPIGRIGFVKNFFISENIESLKKLLKKEGIEKLDLKEVGIRINEKKRIENYDCNNIESLSSGFVPKKELDGREIKQEGIVVGRDLNTVAEKISENEFNKEEISKLIDAFDRESNKFILIKSE